MFELHPFIIKLLCQKTGKDITTPSGAAFLRTDIEVYTGQYLALNTIKRLVGIIPYNFNPRIDTLNIIANYLDFDSWTVLEDYIADRISSIGDNNPFIDLENLPKNTEITVEWAPARKIHLKHLEGQKYLVVSSINSKLNQDDIIFLSQLAVGFPFIAKAVIRSGENLGSYQAAPEKGVSDMKIL